MLFQYIINVKTPTESLSITFRSWSLVIYRLGRVWVNIVKKNVPEVSKNMFYSCKSHFS